MNKLGLSDSEWKLMNLLWDKSPLTIGQMYHHQYDAYPPGG